MIKKSLKLSFVLLTLLLLILWFRFTPDHLLGKANAVGYAVCHRIPSRSLQIDGRPLSLCARCSGQYLGVAFGLLYLGLLGGKRSGKPPWVVMTVMLVSFLVYAVDGVNSLISVGPPLEGMSLYLPRNDFRLFTGMGMGLSLSILVYLLFNRVAWSEISTHDPLSGFWLWAGYYGMGGLVSLAALSGLPGLLYPLMLISVFGVLVLLTVLYGILWVIVMGVENSFRQSGEMVWILLGGFTTGLVQIALLDFIRFWVTGTWSGFHLD